LSQDALGQNGYSMADADRQKLAAEHFSTGLSPEEYAARYAHNWYCFSLDDYRYPDPTLQAWIWRLGGILFHRDGAPSVDELRRRFLSPEERLHIEAEMKQEL
jgi:hypothetical protein